MTLGHSMKGYLLVTYLQQLLVVIFENQVFSVLKALIETTKEIGSPIPARYAFQNIFVWTSPEFQPLESGDFFIGVNSKFKLSEWLYKVIMFLMTLFGSAKGNVIAVGYNRRSSLYIEKDRECCMRKEING